MHPRNDLGGTTALMITAINDKITPIITPYIVPNKSTPNIAARNMKNSALLTFLSLPASLYSTMPISAATTIPVSIGTGRYSSSGVAKRTTTSIVTAAVTDISCDLHPNWSAIPVRDTLPLSGQLPETADATLASEYARTSLLLSTLYPYLLA